MGVGKQVERYRFGIREEIEIEVCHLVDLAGRAGCGCGQAEAVF